MKKIKDFLLSLKAICIILILVCVSFMLFNLYIMRETNIYIFGGYADGITVMDGSIFTSIRINRFASSTIIYNAKDVILKQYEIGYYLKDEPISVILSDENELTDVSLSEFLNNVQFSFTESHNNAKFLSHKNLKNIDNLVFKVKGTTKTDEEINIEVQLDVSKIS